MRAFSQHIVAIFGLGVTDNLVCSVAVARQLLNRFKTCRTVIGSGNEVIIAVSRDSDCYLNLVANL